MNERLSPISGVLPEDYVAEELGIDKTNNPLQLSATSVNSDGEEGTEKEEWPEDELDEDGFPVAQASLEMRSSILKPGVGPVVSPRTPLTRGLSFSDQQGKPLKEIRLYERDLPQGAAARRAQHQMAQDDGVHGKVVVVIIAALFVIIAALSLV